MLAYSQAMDLFPSFCIILYISVCIGPVNISPETSIGSVGEYLNLSCSVDIRDINSLSRNVSQPFVIEWFYGPDIAGAMR